MTAVMHVFHIGQPAQNFRVSFIFPGCVRNSRDSSGNRYATRHRGTSCLSPLWWFGCVCARTYRRNRRWSEYLRSFCNMLLFSPSEYLRGPGRPSPIVPALTDIDNPQEKLAGYLESRIFPGHASALEARASSPPPFHDGGGIKFVSLRGRRLEISCTIEDRDFATS